MTREIKLFLREALNVAKYDQPESEARWDAVDKVAIVAARALLNGNATREFREAIDTLHSIYISAPARSEYIVDLRSQDDVAAAQFWYRIIQRVFLIGSLAVREQQFREIRYIAELRFDVPGLPGYFWLRHAGVMAARAGLLRGPQSEDPGGLILSSARELGKHLPQVADDVQPIGPLDTPAALQSSDPLLDSLCQFDFAWCIVVAQHNPGDLMNEYYPSFAAFLPTRIEPLAAKLERDPEIRKALSTSPRGVDARIAQAVNEVLTGARTEHLRYGGRPNGFLHTFEIK